MNEQEVTRKAKTYTASRESTIEELVSSIKFELDGLEDDLGKGYEALANAQTGILIWREQLEEHMKKCENCEAKKKKRIPLQKLKIDYKSESDSE